MLGGVAYPICRRRSASVAWLRVDTQTILTIANHVITKNHRIGVSYADQRTWKVHIKDVRETDRGWYMCQINTDPMKSQQGYLDVVGK
ncbi:Zwei Ig domain protein zig-8 [Frankliniella fusca]|uniref:Zwei Ig domain protein zig-8 n=1 Tax=Frankliniella fusca TaxID=407009 RepID=A0AAE1GXC7_9NEOP|nr:Zwei Ig domain protein zig-8 [Frankliniella fusca]